MIHAVKIICLYPDVKDLLQRFLKPSRDIRVFLEKPDTESKSEQECHLPVLQQSFKIPILTIILPRSMGGGKTNTTVRYCKVGFDNYRGTDRDGSFMDLRGYLPNKLVELLTPAQIWDNLPE